MVFVDAFPPLLSAALGIARKERKKRFRFFSLFAPTPLVGRHCLCALRVPLWVGWLWESSVPVLELFFLSFFLSFFFLLFFFFFFPYASFRLAPGDG